MRDVRNTEGEAVAGFLDSLKESVLGKEVTLPICSLRQRNPIDVAYTYYEGKPHSHSLLFLKGKRATFQMFLPHYDEDLMRFGSLIENQEYRKEDGEGVFGFWSRLTILLAAGKLMSSCDILTGPSSEVHTRFGDASSAYRYRLAYCRKGIVESIVLVSTRHGRQSGASRKGQSTEFNWLRLSLEQFRALGGYIGAFTKSKDFAKVQEQETTK